MSNTPSSRAALLLPTIAISTGAVAFIVGYLASPGGAKTDFYNAAAQLIPVLLLTLLLQSRVFALAVPVQLLREEAQTQGAPKMGLALLTDIATGGGSNPASDVVAHIVATLGAIVVLVAAELAALHPLATGHPEDGNPHVVYGAIVASFVVIGLLAVVGATTKEP